jgi:hypothetical protein
VAGWLWTAEGGGEQALGLVDGERRPDQRVARLLPHADLDSFTCWLTTASGNIIDLGKIGAIEGGGARGRTSRAGPL